MLHRQAGEWMVWGLNRYDLCSPCALQINATLQPKFAANAFGSSVGGVVFDGLQTLLTNADAAVGTSSTMFAVFRDDGSSGGSTGACCSGVVFFTVGFILRAARFQLF